MRHFPWSRDVLFLHSVVWISYSEQDFLGLNRKITDGFRANGEFFNVDLACFLYLTVRPGVLDRVNSFLNWRGDGMMRGLGVMFVHLLPLDLMGVTSVFISAAFLLRKPRMTAP